MSRTRNRLDQMVSAMPKLSPREAVKQYQVSRATLMSALQNGQISAEKTDAGHWRIDQSELARVYQLRAPQKAVSRTRPEQVNRSEPDQKPPLDHALELRLARAEAALEAEREKTALLQRNLDDLRRMLPPPDAAPAGPERRRRWWPF
jgi:hypothetical protein